MADAVGTALYGILAGNAALITELGGTAIYRDLAPRGRATPFVIISQLSALEENATPSRSERRVYLVKGVAATLAAAEEIAVDIDAALNEATITASGYAGYWCVRESFVSSIELDTTGETFGHAGGEYVVRVNRT